ncbi:TetR family transcriptional regulator [Actinoplanes philippinensis]|uniref:DNA-binding transcriptional regulator, AcrR family n=1 Tax=Actinoplanes philippinensis TaxID=35752 RepID=A0A1I2IB15_9ACTN|nr:TetR/AcrR family transcriptional regulator [Actinoplanes philippinensis]GIE78579.1 TetR family transcriptional regulator [Actinoplanes philippinensis]SFF37741.1 DNA-binding transcriptional regulator, AcrR family [Actinoplanes philippinensis]
MRQDARENRQRILAAADHVFGTHGEAGSTEDVARLAGVGIATVFRHFPTKESLIEAALVRHFTDLHDQTQAAITAPDPTAALHTLIRRMIERGASKLTLASMLSRDAPPAVVTASGQVKAAVDTALRRAQATGSVRPDVGVEELYLLIRGLAQTTAAAPVPAAVLERAVDVILTGFATDSRPATGKTVDSSPTTEAGGARNPAPPDRPAARPRPV